MRRPINTHSAGLGKSSQNKKKQACIYDKTDVKIIDTVDFDFSQMSGNVPKISQIGCIDRCKKFDLIASSFVNNHHYGSKVNIGYTS
jgi:hypothetical protein